MRRTSVCSTCTVEVAIPVAELRNGSPFLQWLLMLGLIAFALVVAWDLGLVELALRSDRSGISVAIALVFIATSVHAAWRAWILSLELADLERLATGGEVHRQIDSASRQRSIAADYLAAAAGGGDRTVLLDVLRERARGSHDAGWLVADLMFKLGILGTVVGFILMLGSVAESDSLDLASLQVVLLQMSEGMRVALYTTLTGLIAGMLLGIQYLVVDRGAERLVCTCADLGEMRRVS